MNIPASDSESAELSRRFKRLKRMELESIAADEIELWQLFRSIWTGRWFIIVVTALAAMGSIAIALYIPNQYKATILLTPASKSAAGSLAKLAGQFGSLAALAGVNLGAQGDGDKTIAAMELVKSWGFQEQFIRDNQLEVPVFAARGWDRIDNRLILDTDIYDDKQGKWVRKYKALQGQTQQPSGWELYEKFSNRVSITQDKKTNLISLSVEYYSPYLAKAWVDKLLMAVNKQLQDQDRLEAEKSIEYLQEKLTQTNLIEMKGVFSHLIEEQTKNLMLARVTDEYVFKTLAPSKVPEKKSSPNRILICASATLGGLLIGVLLWMAKFSLSAGGRTNVDSFN